MQELNKPGLSPSLPLASGMTLAKLWAFLNLGLLGA